MKLHVQCINDKVCAIKKKKKQLLAFTYVTESVWIFYSSLVIKLQSLRCHSAAVTTPTRDRTAHRSIIYYQRTWNSAEFIQPVIIAFCFKHIRCGNSKELPRNLRRCWRNSVDQTRFDLLLKSDFCHHAHHIGSRSVVNTDPMLFPARRGKWGQLTGWMKN